MQLAIIAAANKNGVQIKVVVLEDKTRTTLIYCVSSSVCRLHSWSYQLVILQELILLPPFNSIMGRKMAQCSPIVSGTFPHLLWRLGNNLVRTLPCLLFIVMYNYLASAEGSRTLVCQKLC